MSPATQVGLVEDIGALLVLEHVAMLAAMRLRPTESTHGAHARVAA
jgi:hypothetical protein